jgi:hypothetical protein
MASSSTQAYIDKAHETKDVDTATAGRGVWLVKVRKFRIHLKKPLPTLNYSCCHFKVDDVGAL